MLEADSDSVAGTAGRRRRRLGLFLFAVGVASFVGAALWMLNRPDEQEIAQRQLYEQVSVGPDGVRIDTGDPEFGPFAQQLAVFRIRQDPAGPQIRVPSGFRDVTGDYLESPAVEQYGMFASYIGSINGVTCSVSAFPAERKVAWAVQADDLDSASEEAVAVELLC